MVGSLSKGSDLNAKINLVKLSSNISLVHLEGDFSTERSFSTSSLYLLSSSTTFEFAGHKVKILNCTFLLTEHLIISMVLSLLGKLVQSPSIFVLLISASLRCFRLLNNERSIKHELRTQSRTLSVSKFKCKSPQVVKASKTFLQSVSDRDFKAVRYLSCSFLLNSQQLRVRSSQALRLLSRSCPSSSGKLTPFRYSFLKAKSRFFTFVTGQSSPSDCLYSSY